MTAPKPRYTLADVAHRLAVAISEAGGSRALQDDGARGLMELIYRVDTKRPSADDVFELEKVLTTHPGLWRVTTDLASEAIEEMIGRLRTTASVRIGLRHAAAELRAYASGAQASPLEAVVAEQISVNWIRMRVFDLFLNDAHASEDEVLIRFWENRTASAQARFLASCESLARIRRLAVLTPQLFQINQGQFDPPDEPPALPGE